MKNLRRLIPLVLLLLYKPSLQADVVSEITKASRQLLGDMTESSPIFTNVIDEKKKQQASLIEKRNTIQGDIQDFTRNEKPRLDELTNQITRINRELEQESRNYQFLNKKLDILNKQQQALNDIAQSREHSLSQVTDHLKLITEYLQDPELKTYVKEYLDDRPYPFADLQGLDKQIFEQEKNIDYLLAQEKNAISELEHRKKSAQGTIDNFKKRQDVLSKLAQNTSGQMEAEDMLSFDAQQRTELIRLETHLYDYEKKLDELRIQEIEYKGSLIRTKIFVAKLKLTAQRAALRHIKPLVKIREAEVLAARAEFTKKKQASFAVKENYRQEIDRLAAEKERKSRILTTLSKRYNIPIERDVDLWNLTPRETMISYIGTCEVASLNEQILLLERRRELLEAQLALEDEKMNEEEITIEVKEAYYKVTSRQYINEDEIRKEIKKFGTLQARISASISRTQEKLNTLINLLNLKKRASENLKNLRENLQKQGTTLFRSHTKEFNRCLGLLNESEVRINQTIDLISKTSSSYSDVTAFAESTLKQIDFIVSELDAITIWYRPEYAITWQGIRNIVPDLERFGQELYSFTGQLSPIWIVQAVEQSIHQPMLFFYTVIQLLLVLLLVLTIRAVLPRLNNLLLAREFSNRMLNTLRLLAIFLMNYLLRYFVFFGIWAFFYFTVRFNIITNHYVHILFYLTSIPYLLYAAYLGIRHFASFNDQHDFEIVSRDYSERFIKVISILIYATISIEFFRKALMTGIYHKSELPAILLAFNFIIFQVCLISLITKEQVLSIIPRRGNMWQWLHEFIDRYYYFILAFLVTIIILSNPYVGFSRLVLFTLRGIIYTAVLVRLLTFVHDLTRRGLSQLFFTTDEDTVRERFIYAKSWYGLFVIAAFSAIAVIGIFVITRIWGWFISLREIFEWLESPLIYLGQDVKPITASSIIHIILFCLGGYAISILVTRFLLRRVFDLLLVDTGVQNTVASFTRYLIIIAAIMLGFQNVGLGSLVIYVTGALVLSIGWVIKDPISDFMAYFIILVQRPVKIGDYIFMDHDVMGVVRKITPRSVIIRRFNSTTIIVPNTQVLNRPVTNWNYVQGFCAFDDFTVTVGYKEDPEKVKNIFVHVLDKHPHVLKSPKPVIRLGNFTEAGMEFLIRGFISSNYTLDQWDIASDVRISIVRELHKHGIDISVPMRVMTTLKSATTPQAPRDREEQPR